MMGLRKGKVRPLFYLGSGQGNKQIMYEDNRTHFFS